MTTPTSSSSLPRGDFLSVASQLKFIDAESCRRVEVESRTTNLSASQVALREGLIDAVQADIVETLLRPEEAVPGYEILEWVGRGGMGVVFRARQKSLDRVVAVKTIPATQMNDRTALARFEQEARSVARLRHPNIVAAYDFGRHGGRLYFVMEFVEGFDVERQVELGGPFAEATAWRLVRQAAAGLSHAASEKIIHRDIKPANLLLVDPPAGFELPDGLKMVKVTDFGLAFLARDVDVQTRLTTLNTAIGSPHYLSPEQLSGEAFDHRVDIYALGATAHQLLTGKPPFFGMKLPQLIAQKLSLAAIDVQAEFPYVSDGSAELIRSMTRRNPSARIGSYAELLERIDKVVASAPKVLAQQTAFSATAATQIISVDPTPAAVATHMSLPQSAPAAASQVAGSKAPESADQVGRRRVLVALGSGVLVAGGGAAAVWKFWPSPKAADKNPRPLVPIGLGQHLFDGLSLNGWRAHSGAWKVQRNTEGGRVLSGTSGSISHALANKTDKRTNALSRFRLSVVIQLHGATTAEIEFARDISVDDGPRYVAQLSKNAAAIGRRADEAGRCQVETPVLTLPHDPADPFTLAVERQADAWWVLLDDRPVGHLPVAVEPTAPEFSLRAEQGEAWFSDIIVQAMGMPQTDAGQ
jgi:serine/threonine protein kinase